MNKLRGTLNVCVAGPWFWRSSQGDVEDIGILTNGLCITEDLGIKLENVAEHLGSAKRITVDKDNTTIAEGGGDSSKIAVASPDPSSDRRDDSDYDREKLQERLAVGWWCCCHPRWWRNGNRNEGKEGSS